MHNDVKCTRCKRSKRQFYKHRPSMCKSCADGLFLKKWNVYLLSSAISNSKRKNLKCTITKEYILELFEKQNGKCYWFGIELIPSVKSKDPQKPTLDRLSDKKGYVKGNVVISCLAANLGRNTTSVRRFKQFSKLLRSNEQ